MSIAALALGYGAKIGHNDDSVDATTNASARNSMDEKVKFIK
ncbi:hypothetical protein [Acetivibrio thermocellus]|nr:hypothetical protein [Acetivibrio thermocellus]UWV46306.1 hypothetical protein N1236_12115 [Acetivibrio thermocellus]